MLKGCKTVHRIVDGNCSLVYLLPDNRKITVWFSCAQTSKTWRVAHHSGVVATSTFFTIYTSSSQWLTSLPGTLWTTDWDSHSRSACTRESLYSSTLVNLAASAVCPGFDSLKMLTLYSSSGSPQLDAVPWQSLVGEIDEHLGQP